MSARPSGEDMGLIDRPAVSHDLDDVKIGSGHDQENSRPTNFCMVFHEWAAGTRTPRATTSAIKFVLAFGTPLPRGTGDLHPQIKHFEQCTARARAHRREAEGRCDQGHLSDDLGLVSEDIHSIKQPALAETAVELKLYRNGVELPHLFCPVFGSGW